MGETVVVDYKFGAPHRRHHEQVQQLLRTGSHRWGGATSAALFGMSTPGESIPSNWSPNSSKTNPLQPCFGRNALAISRNRVRQEKTVHFFHQSREVSIESSRLFFVKSSTFPAPFSPFRLNVQKPLHGKSQNTAHFYTFPCEGFVMCALIATFAVETTDVSPSARPCRKSSAARSLCPSLIFRHHRR